MKRRDFLNNAWADTAAAAVVGITISRQVTLAEPCHRPHYLPDVDGTCEPSLFRAGIVDAFSGALIGGVCNESREGYSFSKDQTAMTKRGMFIGIGAFVGYLGGLTIRATGFHR